MFTESKETAMGKKTTHLDRVCIRVAPKKGEENTRVQLTTGYFAEEKVIGQFWIPANTSAYSLEFYKLVAARAKHDLGITYNWYSGASCYI